MIPAAYKTKVRVEYPLIKKSLSLAFQLSKRELFSRYKGSFLGFGWVLVNPLLMLCVYVFVFSEVFRVKWPATAGAPTAVTSPYEFGLMLMIGLSVFQFFSETLSKSPSSVLSQPNLVTKVQFQTELLPLATTFAGFAHFLINISLIVCGALMVGKSVGLSYLALPFLAFGMFMTVAGLSFLLAAIGVYVRDLGHSVAALMGALMFLTPVFFPASSFPAKFRAVVDWNPMAIYIEAMRSVIGANSPPSFLMIFICIFTGALTFLLGLKAFGLLKRGFADVL